MRTIANPVQTLDNGEVCKVHNLYIITENFSCETFNGFTIIYYFLSVHPAGSSFPVSRLVTIIVILHCTTTSSHQSALGHSPSSEMAAVLYSVSQSVSPVCPSVSQSQWPTVYTKLHKYCVCTPGAPPG